MQAGPLRRGSMITSVNTRANISMQGRTIADLAADRGLPWAEAVLDFLVEEGNEREWSSLPWTRTTVRRKLTLPWMKFGDRRWSAGSVGAGLDDPTRAPTGSYPKILGQYVRDEEDHPARRRGAKDDVGRSGSGGSSGPWGGLPRATLPIWWSSISIGSTRSVPTRDPMPWRWAWSMCGVNGQQVVRDAEYTGALPGRFLRGSGELAEGR